MKWLTVKEVKKAAKSSTLAALKCSKLHWEQLRDASPEDLRTKDKQPGGYLAGATYCALCKRFIFPISTKLSCPLDSVSCPMWGKRDGKCCDVYYKALHEFSLLLKKEPNNFRQKANRVIKRIQKKIRQEQNEPS